MNSKTVLRWVYWMMIIVGLVFVVIALFAARSSLNLVRDGVRTSGNVVDMLESYDSDDGTIMYTAVFSFLDQSGQEHTVQSHSSSSDPSYTIGEAVEIIYLPARPDSAELASFFSIWGLALIFGILGFVSFVGGVLLRLFFPRLSPNPDYIPGISNE